MKVIGVVLKRFERPDVVRNFPKGKFEIIRIGGMTIGRATYEPGWRYSEHVASGELDPMCQTEHVGIVLNGCATAAIVERRPVEMHAGDIFYVPAGPPGHDSWVVGNERYVSLHLMGADHYSESR